MKVLTDTKPAFKPVTIVLETQEEVNHLYSVLRHNYVTPYGEALGDAFEQIEGMVPDYNNVFDAFRTKLNKKFNFTPKA